MPSFSRALDLPPPFRLATLREAGDAFGHAMAHAGELGAGTLVFVGRFDTAEFAVVLEPDEPLAAARRSFYAGMTALADTLAAFAAPETPISIGWPDALEVDRGLVGGGWLGWPLGANENEVPDWLVFGAAIRLAWVIPGEAGHHPASTALTDEGFGDITGEQVAEGFARHLMLAIDRWQEGRFADIAHDYLARLRPEHGTRHGIAPNGDLCIERTGEPAILLDLRAALESPSWFDPASGGPRR